MTLALRPSGSKGTAEIPARSSSGTLSFRCEKLTNPDALGDQWRAFDEHGSHSFFLSWPWIGALASCGEEFSVITALRREQPVGLALAAARAGRWSGFWPVRQLWLNATGDHLRDGVMLEHNGFAVPGAPDGTLWPSFLRWFAQGGAGAEELIVPGLAAEAGTGGLLVGETRKKGFCAPLRGSCVEDILHGLSRNTRQKLRRDLRLAGGLPVADVAADAETAWAYFQAMKTLHIRSWETRAKKNAFSNPHFEDFHRRVIAAGTAIGAVQMMRVRIESRVLGYLYNFVRNDVVYNYQSGFETSETSVRSGYLCHLTAMAQYAKQALDCYDFLAGTNQLKTSLGPQAYELSWRCYRRRGPAACAEHAIRKFIARSTGGKK